MKNYNLVEILNLIPYVPRSRVPASNLDYHDWFQQMLPKTLLGFYHNLISHKHSLPFSPFWEISGISSFISCIWKIGNAVIQSYCWQQKENVIQMYI